MNPVVKTALYNVDSLILGLPTAPLALLGAGFAYLEDLDTNTLQSNQSNQFLKTIGMLGHRTCNAINSLLALPMLIWNIAKTAFANLLNALTFGKIDKLVEWADYTYKMLTITTLYATLSGHMTLEAIPEIKKALCPTSPDVQYRHA